MKTFNEDILGAVGVFFVVLGTGIQFGIGYACIVGGVLAIAIAAATARVAQKDLEHASTQPSGPAR
jgi:hypothetical protein